MVEKRVNLPDGLLISWYGDDFTGSSAVMEVLSLAGLPSVLFLDVPTPELLARFTGYRGMGIAGVARSKPPRWMEEHLPRVFSTLAQWQAPVTHYKMCSTLDSAPHVGSVGKAIDLAHEHFGRSQWIPLVVAAPAIKRYQVFGNLFVGVAGVRLDRDPAMINHPITPMTESDVRVHLSKQTSRPIGLVDCLALQSDRADQMLRGEIDAGRRIVALDVLDEATLAGAGRLIWEQRGEGLFAVGSQGVEYALVSCWRRAGFIAEVPPPRAAAVDRIAVVSGSCSAVTAAQITWAEAHGFKPIRIDARLALDPRTWSGAIEVATRAALLAIDEGYDPIVFSARGPDDQGIGELKEAIATAGADSVEVNEAIGRGLGLVLDSIFKRTGIRRGILAGGDTSGHGANVLGVEALTLAAPTVPGAALFRAHSREPEMRDLELALKGGQMGAPGYFGQIKCGGLI